jgi:hypothetical protein
MQGNHGMRHRLAAATDGAKPCNTSVTRVVASHNHYQRLSGAQRRTRVRRHPRGLGRSGGEPRPQPFTAPMVMPFTKYRWKNG